MAKLTRIAYGNDHQAMRRSTWKDTVIISRCPVPGNELRVHDSINQLAWAGVEVLHEETAPGMFRPRLPGGSPHDASSPLRPRYMMPIHGEYRMQAAHAKLAREAGVPEERIILGENGSVVEPRPRRRAARGQVMRASRSSTASASATCRTSPPRPAAPPPTTVFIVVTTLSSSNGGEIAPPELIARARGVGGAARRAP